MTKYDIARHASRVAGFFYVAAKYAAMPIA